MARKTDPPGFRFQPTDEELVVYYLKRKVTGKSCPFKGISEIELYEFDPWELPAIAKKSFPESRNHEWYFFCRQYQKNSIGSRIDRATKNGFWKSTGKDKSVLNNSRTVGKRKTLVFYTNSASQRNITNWVIYEYRLEDARLANLRIAQDAYVLCKIFEKSGPGPRNGEQYGAPFKEEDWDEVPINGSSLLSPAANYMPLPPGPVNDQTIVISEKEPNPLLEHDPQIFGVPGVEEQSDSPPNKKRTQSPSPKIPVANDIPLPPELMINPNIIVAMKEPNSLLEHDHQPSGVSPMEEQSHSPENHIYNALLEMLQSDSPPIKKRKQSPSPKIPVANDIPLPPELMTNPNIIVAMKEPNSHANDYNERSEAPNGSMDGFLADQEGDLIYNDLGDFIEGFLEKNDLLQPMETVASGSANNQYPIFEGSNSSAGLTMMDTEALWSWGVSRSEILSSHSDL